MSSVLHETSLDQIIYALFILSPPSRTDPSHKPHNLGSKGIWVSEISQIFADILLNLITGPQRMDSVTFWRHFQHFVSRHCECSSLRPRGSLQITLLTFTAVWWEEAVSLWGFFFIPSVRSLSASLPLRGIYKCHWSKESTAAACKWNEPFKTLNVKLSAAPESPEGHKTWHSFSKSTEESVKNMRKLCFCTVIRVSLETFIHVGVVKKIKFYWTNNSSRCFNDFPRSHKL